MQQSSTRCCIRTLTCQDHDDQRGCANRAGYLIRDGRGARGDRTVNRCYCASTPDWLDGRWTPLPDEDTYQEPFAGTNSVTCEEGVVAWTKDIRRGELVRDGYDETMTIDPRNLQMLHRGRHPSIRATHNLLRYRRGRLKLVQVGSRCANGWCAAPGHGKGRQNRMHIGMSDALVVLAGV